MAPVTGDGCSRWITAKAASGVCGAEGDGFYGSHGACGAGGQVAGSRVGRACACAGPLCGFCRVLCSWHRRCGLKKIRSAWKGLACRCGRVWWTDDDPGPSEGQQRRSMRRSSGALVRGSLRAALMLAVGGRAGAGGTEGADGQWGWETSALHVGWRWEVALRWWCPGGQVRWHIAGRQITGRSQVPTRLAGAISQPTGQT